MRDPFLLLLLLIVGVSGVYSGHFLQYYLTGVSIPGYGLPEFSEVGYMDGIEIVRYSSDTGRLVPVAPWMKKVDPEYWKTNTQISKGHEVVFRQSVKNLMIRFNQTGGYHSVQRMYGCELRDDGSTKVYYQCGYDGKDFLTLDTERGIYYPLSIQAEITTRRWNKPEVREGERWKNYLEIECIHWLKIHLKNGKEERRVRPKVKVSDQNVHGVTKLHCQVYGFYPRDVDVNWRKNGIDVPSDEAKHVLPNTDGTFQIRVTVEAAAEDLKSYSCHVDHVSLNQILTVKWEPPSRSNIWWIVIGVLAGLIASTAVGFVTWRKRSGKKTYAPTNTSDKDGSSTSSSA